MYFVTAVTWQRECLLGAIEGAQVMLSPVGQAVHREWRRLTSRFPGVGLDEFVIMPNHVHGIIVIHDHPRGAAGAQQEPRAIEDNFRSTAPRQLDPRNSAAESFDNPDSEQAPLHLYGRQPTNVAPGSLGAIVRAFKSSTAYRYNRMRLSSGSPLWQRNYYEHIIRNEAELERIRRYIRDNPAQWEIDHENPNQNPPKGRSG
jgi:REP element-mobilizing transposase RayT